MEYDYKTLEEKFKNLPEDVQEALSSVSVAAKVKSIGQKHDLKIDQESVLFDLISFTVLGLIPSKDFVKKLSQEAGIEDSVAQNIGVDVNKEVFDSIKASMQAGQQAEIITPAPNQLSNSSLERAGGFEIEPEDLAPEPTIPDTHSGEETLAHIENPQPAPAQKVRHTEPLIDMLLNGPGGFAPKKPSEPVVETPRYGAPETKSTPPENLPTNDPYREPTK